MNRIATLPDMWERTITFGSGGKTFGVTGWRIGWAIGPQPLLKYMLAVHARTVFTAPTPLQDAVAAGFEHCSTSSYFEETRVDYKRRRDLTVDMFTDLNLPVAVPHGSYFFIVETSKIHVDLPKKPSEEHNDSSIIEPRDYAMCRWLTTEMGVTAIPPSAFYSQENKHLAENHIRICFCKTDDTLNQAKERLQHLKKYIR